MLCERCKKNEANYYYHENVNGNEKTYHLCSDCAKELEKSGEIKQWGMNFTSVASPVDDFFHNFFGLDDTDSLFGSLFAPMSSHQAALRSGSHEEKCPLCGATFRDLTREGKVGCPKCYETFADELEESIRRIHGRSSHTGHAPFKFREKTEAKQKLHALEKELKEEVKNENYERAAELRDEIRALRDNGGTGCAE